jgi:hypothetical protein
MANTKSVSEMLDGRQAKAEQGDWRPASNGTEKPFKTRSGRTLQYMWQPATGKHAYIDCETDILLTHEEAWEELR